MKGDLYAWMCVVALAGCAGGGGDDSAGSEDGTAPVENVLTLDSKGFAFDLDSPVPFEIRDGDGQTVFDGDAGIVEEEDAVRKEVWGSDGRVRYSANSYPYRAHAALRRTSSATDAYCTGFKITPRHILTAAHCLYWSGAWQSYPETLRVVYFQNGTNTGTKYAPIRFWVPPAWISSTPAGDTSPNWNYDYALITLADADNTPGWFDFQAQSSVSTSMTARFGGYPGASSSCADGISGRCAGWQYRSTGPFDRIYSNLFITRADWESGQSGGPIYYLPSGQTQYKALGVISHHRSPASGSSFVVGTHGNRGLRITSSIESALCARINNERPSTVPSHHCYQ